MEDEDIRVIKRQYLQQIPVRSLTLPASLPAIQSCLWDTVLLPSPRQPLITGPRSKCAQIPPRRTVRIPLPARRGNTSSERGIPFRTKY
jgi:hypothetical protein